MRAKKDRTASHFLPRPIEGTNRTVRFASVAYLLDFLKKRIYLAIMMREPYEADDMMARSIQPTRSNSFNNDSEDLRMLP